MMNKEAKKNYIEEMKKNFTSNESVMIAQYQGLNVTELDELRKELSPIFTFGLIKFCSIIFFDEFSRLRLFSFANS